MDIQLENFRRRLEDRHIRIELTDAAKTHLVRVGYDPNYGARPLKRAIQKEVETPLAKSMLRGEVRDGQMVVVDFNAQGDKIRFTAKPVEEPVLSKAS